MTGEYSYLILGATVVNFLLYVEQSCKIIKTASLKMPRVPAFRGNGC